LAEILEPMQKLVEDGNIVIPIVSPSVLTMDTRFGEAQKWIETFERICQNAVIDSIVGAEPVGPKLNLDVVVVAPCTGNTLARLANSVTDTAVTMAVKGQLRNERPVVLAIATNDGLAGSAINIGKLLDKKHVYFVPFGQDNPKGKPRSLVCSMKMLINTVELAIEGKQIQPILLR
jgi:dipicolinate synthase subunit B